ncbi:hypothetical protein BN1723_013825 [Verticillium longisporum]|uniref:Uncharacterized protein n=1 Tax=Verticillium longisporum TaxID=100787 RepID=A0A0G4LWF9_VERLO|nr:hypothetical protein BN1723_013825 [Verticillium longisporum]
MRTQSVLSIIVAAVIGRVAAQEEPVTGELGDAPIVEGNPPGVVYEATREGPFAKLQDVDFEVDFRTAAQREVEEPPRFYGPQSFGPDSTRWVGTGSGGRSRMTGMQTGIGMRGT